MDSYVYMVSWLRSRFSRSDRGASLIEYALLVALIAMVCLIGMQFVGTQANSRYDGVGSSLQG